MNSHPSVLEHLLFFATKSTLLKGVDEKTLEQLARIGELTIPDKGVLLCRQGTPGATFFLVTKGELEAYTENPYHQTLGIMKAGGFFGEISVFHTQKRTASVITKTACELLEFRREPFGKIVEKTPLLQSRLNKRALERTEYSLSDEIIGDGSIGLAEILEPSKQ